MLLRLGQPDEAIVAFRQAVEARHPSALYNLGIVYLRDKRDPTRAREVLERAVGTGQASADTWNALGAAYALGGELERARRAWDEALRLNPDHAQARRNRTSLGP